MLTRPQFSHSTNSLHLTINQVPPLGHPHSNSSAPINYTGLEVCVLECYPRPCTTTQITRVLHISEAMQLHNIKHSILSTLLTNCRLTPNRPCAFNCMPTNLRTHNILRSRILPDLLRNICRSWLHDYDNSPRLDPLTCQRMRTVPCSSNRSALYRAPTTQATQSSKHTTSEDIPN